MTAAPTLSPPAVRGGAVNRPIHWILVANVWAQSLILLSGAVVRLTSSGLGCPTWPTCTGNSWIPVAGQVQGWHKYVEFTNRTLTGVLIVIAFVAFGAVVFHVFTRQPRRTVLVWLAAVPLFGTFVQAVLGGITVLTKLNPWTVSAHFLVSITIVFFTVTLQIRADETGDGPLVLTVHPIVRKASIFLTCVGGFIVLLGVVTTGSGPHAGDKVAARFHFDQRVVAWFHADTVLFFLGLLIGIIIALYVTDAPDVVRRRAWYIVIIACGQGAIGYTQWFTGLPEALVAMHVAGATLLWVFLTRYLLSTRSRTAVDVTLPEAIPAT